MPKMPFASVRPGYKAQSEDTSIDADVLMFRLLRQMNPQQKAERMIQFNSSVRQLALSGIHSQYPGATTNRIRQEYIKRRLGSFWLEILERAFAFNTSRELKQHDNLGEPVIADPISLARKIASLLEPLNIPYVVGGSVASSLLGETRATLDLDLAIYLMADQAQQLFDAMQSDFYISFSAVTEALERKGSFNVIYLPSMEKADIFVLPDDLFSRSKMSRRQLHVCGGELDGSIYIYSAEDIILQKLRWYKLTLSESQKQWRDVLGVLKVQGERLDIDYLNRWAETLKLTDLLANALREAGLVD